MEPIAPLLPEPDHLERIVTLIDAITAPQGFAGPHLLVKVESTLDPDEFELGLKPMPDDAHPVDELWGFEAPPSWQAIGVVTYGWCGPMFEGRPSLHPDRRRIRATIVVDRSGRQASTAALDDGTVIDEPGEGVIGDVLLRAVGRPTAPPPPLEHLADILWLQEVLDAEAPLSWAAMRQLRTALIAADTSWSRLRRLAATRPEWAHADPWMDDGFFARQLLASLPSVDELMGALAERYPPAVVTLMRALVSG